MTNSGNYADGRRRGGTFLERAAAFDVPAVGIVPLQFGGGFIGLAVLFLILALVAGVLGARRVAGLSMEIAKWLVIIFVVLAIVSFVL